MTLAPHTTSAPATIPADLDPRDPYTRLGSLFDPGTMAELSPRDTSGAVAARGLIDGKPATAFCTDAQRMGGAMGIEGCKHIVTAIDVAVAESVPVIGLWHSGGARLAEGVAALDAVGLVFAAMVRASGKIPQISVVLGPAAGGAAYGPALTDVVIMSSSGRVFVTGPDVVRSVTGENVDMESLGGPDTHGRRSGVVHAITETDADAIAHARLITSAARPAGRVRRITGGRAATTSQALLPENRKRAYDVHPLVTGLRRQRHVHRIARSLGAQRRDRFGSVGRSDGRRDREQPVAPRRLPRLGQCREGGPVRAHVRRVRRATRRPRRRTRAICQVSARNGMASCDAAQNCYTHSPRQ